MSFCLTVIHKIYIIRRSSFDTKPSSSNLNRRFGRVFFFSFVFFKALFLRVLLVLTTSKMLATTL